MAFMLGHGTIREAAGVHTELLTLTTSCRIYNLSEEALARESSKVLKRRGEVCGCPDSSSWEPLRHHLLHDGELHASPAMQPDSL
ncbi:unnamed protein product [Tetraodon nigroviridis]|uniref:(spotted green pufferfish) hypothetical protein n=1 Tax=Tetraodon nigroviridis TaxID=99883 RepID=Q4SFK3_TETNG|nr:unnamed protein product [Tetraodon nigroviridis]